VVIHSTRVCVCAVLKIVPDDFDAVACKVATLVDLRRTKEALDLIDTKVEYRDDRFSFEYAYCLYREGRREEALGHLSKVPEHKSLDRKRLEGQLRYRLEEYDACIKVYTELFKAPYNEDSVEAKANLIAAYVAGGRSGEIPSVLKSLGCSSTDGLELAFNVACGMIEDGSVEQEVKEQLMATRRIGEETLFDEGLDDDEMAEELAGVDVQLGFVQALEHAHVEAMNTFKSVLDLDGPDEIANVIAAANVVLCHVQLHTHDRRGAQENIKVLESFLERSGGVLKVRSDLQNRLGHATCQGILATYAAGAIAANKVDHAREAVRSLETMYPGLPLGSLMQATILARDGKTKEAVAVLLAHEGKMKGSAVEASSVLLHAQLASHSQDYNKASDLLNSLPENIKSKPAVVATRTALLELAGSAEAAERVASMALNSSDDDARRWALKKLATVEIASGKLMEAASRLLELTKVDRASLEDPALLRLLPRCIACCDPSRHAEMSSLQDEPHDFSGVDVDTLESQAGNMLAHTKQKDEEDVAQVGEKKAKKKRKRKIRYPKNFDPENPGPLPDPERWLPKWQRAENRKLRKKKKEKDATRGSQGAGKVDMALDRTGAMDAPPPKTTASTATAPRSNKKKKKGKGKR